MLWMTAETILSLCHIREGFIRKLNINLGFKIMNRDYLGLPRGLSGKESACQAGDVGSIPQSGRSPGGENGNPLQYSFLENPRGQRSLWAAVHGVAELDTTEQLSTAKH